MKKIKTALKWILYILSIPLLYVIISYLLSSITIHRNTNQSVSNQTVYLSTNGVHLDVIIPKKLLSPELLKGLEIKTDETHIAFGWGDENFYINTPTWGDLTFKNAFSALFMKSSTLIHLTKYKKLKTSWQKVNISSRQLNLLNIYILDAFKLDENGNKILLKNKGYSTTDNFYKADGSYSCLNTCNSWVNTGFKNADLKACLWTPFDFGLMQKYE